MNNLPDDWAESRRKCPRCGQAYHLSGAEDCACQGEWDELTEEASEHLAKLAAFSAGVLDGSITYREAAWVALDLSTCFDRLEDVQQRIPRCDD